MYLKQNYIFRPLDMIQHSMLNINENLKKIKS